jgi:hypothetical protein
MVCNAVGSVQVAKPLDSAVNPTPALAACRLAYSWPLTHTLTGYGKYEQIFTNPAPKSSSTT